MYVEKHFSYVHATFEAEDGAEYTIIMKYKHQNGQIKVFVEQERVHLGDRVYIFEPGSGRSETLTLKGPEFFEIRFVSENEIEKIAKEHGFDRKKCLKEALEKANEILS